MAGIAPLEYGIHLRIWRAGRFLAAAPTVHGARCAGDLLRCRHRAGALAGPTGGNAAGGVGDRLAWPQMDRLPRRSEEHTSELQSRENLVCRLLLEKKKKDNIKTMNNKA